MAALAGWLTRRCSKRGQTRPERLKKLKEINPRFLRVFFSNFSNLSTFLLEVWFTLKVPTDPAMSPRQVSWKLRVVWRQKLAELSMFAVTLQTSIWCNHLFIAFLFVFVHSKICCQRLYKEVSFHVDMLLMNVWREEPISLGRKELRNEWVSAKKKGWKGRMNWEGSEWKITIINRFHSVFTSVVVSSGDVSLW